MKILLIYYTGTFNTRYICNMVKNKFLEQSHQVDVFEWNYDGPQTISMEGYDIIGFGYPIYGFNIPSMFIKFLKKQKYPSQARYFVFKNSGETYSANDSSSHQLDNVLKKHKCRIDNEYHFMMPYNIHFRYEDELVHEILKMDDLLADILVYEIINKINHNKKYKLINDLIAITVRLQYLGGPVNSLFMKVDNKKCVGCKKCILDCPVHNIYVDKKGKIKFHHHCVMCMRCTLFCPKDAVIFGLFASWKVNGRYDLDKIKSMDVDHKIITKDTEGFFKCYIKTYNYINDRHDELFNKNISD